jgi:hypothetical protein
VLEYCSQPGGLICLAGLAALGSLRPPSDTLAHQGAPAVALRGGRCQEASLSFSC